MGNILKLWYNKPALDWNEALPIGNGKLGAMVYGSVFQEKLQMNEDSVWYGGYVDRNNPDAEENLPRIRNYILQGKLDEAHELAQFALTGIPDSQRSYQCLGDILIGFKHQEESYCDYRRELDLKTATMKVDYTVDSIHYSRHIFCSRPDNVTVMRITADKRASIHLNCLLRRGNYLPEPAKQKTGQMCLYSNEKYFDTVEKISDDQIMLLGNCGKGGVEFCLSLKVKVKNGSCRVIGEHIVIREADEVIFFISSYTTFREKNYKQVCTDTLLRACEKGYGRIWQDHVEDYGRIFNRVIIDIKDNQGRDFSDMPTDERLKKYEENEDNDFLNIYFQFCRYIMLASSRGDSLPANLQGIWCNEYAPSWDSKFTININTEMNYWPVETANLSECHEPLFKFLKRLAENGKKTARVMYGCRGFVAHHNTDIWADAAPQDIVFGSTFWVFGGAWLALHIWEHFQFTQDKVFLKEYYNILKEAALFFVDYLMEDEDGTVFTCPSQSPENVFVINNKHYALTKSCTMDFEILRHLFKACIEASGILETDADFAGELKELIVKFPERKIGSYGQLLEWEKEYEEIDPGHRHFSHLFSLCPGNLIDVDETPELAEACRKSIGYRLNHGSAHTGWSRAWVINFFARLRDGEKVYKHLTALFKLSTQRNLFNSHPPFQIDGNFGALNAMCEMFVQSQNKIILLPALPERLKTGSVTGLRLRGNITVNLYWQNHELTRAEFISPNAKTIRFSYKGQEYDADLKANQEFTFIFS